MTCQAWRLTAIDEGLTTADRQVSGLALDGVSSQIGSTVASGGCDAVHDPAGRQPGSDLRPAGPSPSVWNWPPPSPCDRSGSSPTAWGSRVPRRSGSGPTAGSGHRPDWTPAPPAASPSRSTIRGPAEVSCYGRTGRWPEFLVGGRGAAGWPGRRLWARFASVRRSSVRRSRSGTPVLAGRPQPTSHHSRSP